MNTFTTNESFETWFNKDFISDSTKALISKSDILIVPIIDFRDGSGPTFERGTETIFNFFKENLPEGYLIEICIDESNYSELSINSKVKRIGKIIIREAAVPVFVGLLTVALQNIIFEDEKPQSNNITISENVDTNIINSGGSSDFYKKKYMEPAAIQLSITVVKNDGSSKEFKYEGQAEDLKTSLNSISQILKDDTDTTINRK